MGIMWKDLTEQICTNNTLGCVGHKDGKCNSIENCKYKVEQPVITIGDKIRESNESLAEAIDSTPHGCDFCKQHRSRCNNECYTNVLAYLNQPYTE